MHKFIGFVVACALIAPAVALASSITGGVCSGPMSVGWRVDLPGGGCGGQAFGTVAPTPGVSIQNADGTWTLHAATATISSQGLWHLENIVLL